jgi:hypothetical protein
MSSHGMHVHGPHDHELEHAAQGSIDSFGGQLAVVTAVLATVGAIFSFMSGATESEALRLENEASIRRSEADAKWALALATNGQLHLAGLALELAPESRKPFFQNEVQRQATEIDTIKKAAEGLDGEAIALDVASDEQLRRHHRWSQATTVLQISIAMAAIALLTKRKWLVYGVFGLGGVGLVIGALAWMQI